MSDGVRIIVTIKPFKQTSMKTVYKFPIDLTDRQVVTMPAGAKILKADVVFGRVVCLWALVDPNAKKEERIIVVLGTGHAIEDKDAEFLEHIDTVLMQEGAFVWHIFEER